MCASYPSKGKEVLCADSKMQTTARGGAGRGGAAGGAGSARNPVAAEHVLKAPRVINWTYFRAAAAGK